MSAFLILSIFTEWKEPQMPDNYETSDYQVAVTLHSLGFKLVFVDKTDPHRAVFQFDYDQEIPKVIEAFFRDELNLNPRYVLTSAKLVKDRLHAGH